MARGPGQKRVVTVAVCTVCQKEVSVTKDSKLRKHHKRPDYVCPGSRKGMSKVVPDTLRLDARGE